MERGIIAAPGIIKPFQGGFTMERSISKEEIRYYILYWDKVVIPGNNLFYIGIPEEEDLIACNAISRPRVSFQGSFQGDQITGAILACQSLVSKKLVHDKSVDWVIHQIGQALVLPSDFASKQETIRVALTSVLPVPDEQVSIQKILEFKQKRSDELVELHNSIDELYFEILNSPNQDLATKKAVSRFQSAIHNIDQITNENFKKTRKYDLSAELNLSGKDIICGASAGALIDFFSNGFTIPIATLLGAIIPMIKIVAKASYTFEPARENTKLSYISSASKEKLIGL